MSVYKEILDDFVWSYSRLKLYITCPYAFYRHYICGEDGEQNYYAANGSLVHDLFNRVIRGELPIGALPESYIEEYDYITETTYKSTMDKTFDSCLSYLCEIDENILDGYEVIGSEIKQHFSVCGYDFIGFIDLLLKDKSTGELVLVDHKASSKFLKKNGQPYANMKESYESYSIQMYLYCIAIKNTFGKYPAKIVWHHFKDGSIDVVPFDIKGIENAKNWVLDTLEAIENDESFECNKSYIMCSQLCDFRNDCEYKEDQDDE